MNSISRRNIIKMFGGLVAGTFFTPLPWKLLQDSSIVTQTGPWITKVPRGQLSAGYSTCTLCLGGCGVRARTIAGVPFSLSAIPNHPLSFGTLCAAGVAAHQSAYHPLRVRTPLNITHNNTTISTNSISLDEVQSRLTPYLNEADRGSIAILDLRPGRTASLAYRKMLGVNGRYIIPSYSGADTFDMMCETPYGPTGYDLENSKLVVSLGAPLLEPWGNPSRLLQSTSGERPKIIQIETRRSRTATLADKWIRIKPESETAVVLGLANVIINNGLYDAQLFNQITLDSPAYIQLVKEFSTQRVEKLTGIPANHLTDLAHEMTALSPTVVVNSQDADRYTDIAVSGLNLLLGNLEKEGGVISKNTIPVQSELEESLLAPITVFKNIPDHSIKLLLIDDPGTAKEIPWEAIRQKLSVEHSLAICFSPFLAGIGRNADIIIPTPAPFESLTDSPNSANASKASFAVASPLLSRTDGIADPVEFLGKVFSVSGTMEQYLRGRVDAILKKGEGVVFNYKDGSTVEVSSFGSADDLWSGLVAGALWLNESKPTKQLPKVHLLGKESNTAERMRASALKPEHNANSMTGGYPFTLIPFIHTVGVGAGQLSPLMTKVYQESGIRSTSNVAIIDPLTAQLSGLDDGDIANLDTALGSRKMKVTIDGSGMPGIIHVSASPDPIAFTKEGDSLDQNIFSLVQPDSDCSWKPTPANLRKVS